MPWLVALLTNLVGSFLARVLTGAGLALGTTAAVMPMILSALNGLKSALGGLPGDMLNVCLLGGLGEGLSIIGSAILTAQAISAGKTFVQKAATK